MVTVPSSVTSEPIARGCHSPFLGNAMMDHPCPWHLPQQHCSPSTCLWGYHNATVHSIFHLLSCAQHQCFMPVTEVLSVSSQGPTRFLWPWYTSPGTYGKWVHMITSCTSLEAAGQSSTGSSHVPALLASPLASPVPPMAH